MSKGAAGLSCGTHFCIQLAGEAIMENHWTIPGWLVKGTTFANEQARMTIASVRVDSESACPGTEHHHQPSKTHEFEF